MADFTENHFSTLTLNEAIAQELLITISDTMEDVIFDGKWTHKTEWKHSSLDSITSDIMDIKLRHAHQGDFIYFLIDFISDTNLENGEDKAMICLNPKENPNPDTQFCFITILNTEYSSIIKRTANSESFEEIEKPEDFIANSTVSDKHDRYSSTPHTSYEFKIPLELVGRSNVYGLYLAAYDAHSNNTFTHPLQTEPVSFDLIPDTNNWAKLVSPDKSLPEFHWIIFVILSSFTLVIFLSRRQIIKTY